MKNKEALTVLIIEDEQMFRSLALQAFEGFNKITAVNAEEGLERFKESCPDITLLDIGLPGKSGLDILPEMIGFDPEAFIVMLTASCVLSDVETAKRNGASGYIIKPFTYKKVEQCIANYKAYKRKLESLTSEERANNLLENLKIEHLEEDMKLHSKDDDIIAKAIRRDEHIKKEIATWHILFVDDLRNNRQKAQAQLTRLGCSVDTASNGSEVLSMIRKKQYNAIFMDTHIKGISGYETAVSVRELDKDILIIAMLDTHDEIIDDLWKKAGMNNYLKKPARFTELRSMIEISARKKLGL